MAADSVPGWYFCCPAPNDFAGMIEFVQRRAVWIRESLSGRFGSELEAEITREFKNELNDPGCSSSEPQANTVQYSRRLVTNIRYWLEHHGEVDFPAWRDCDGDGRELIKIDEHLSEVLKFLRKRQSVYHSLNGHAFAITAGERQPEDSPGDVRVRVVSLPEQAYQCPNCGGHLPAREVTFDEKGRPELRWCRDCRDAADRAVVRWKQYPFKDYSFSIVVRDVRHLPPSIPIPPYTPTEVEIALFQRLFPSIDHKNPNWETVRGILLVRHVSVDEGLSIHALLGVLHELTAQEEKAVRKKVPKPARASAVKLKDKAIEARDKWIYEECCKGVPYDTIAIKLKSKSNTWPRINSKQGIQNAAVRYAQRNNLTPIPSRQDL